MFEFLTLSLAVALSAAAVKLFDDWLDQELDAAACQPNWAAALGPGTTVYAALLLAVAAALQTTVSLALFFASYCVGMFTDLGRLFPSRLRGWQEALVILGIGIVAFGWRMMLFALLFIGAVQLFDDCLDLAADRYAGRRNLACLLGKAECLLAGLAFMLAAWWLDGGLFPPVFFGTSVFYLGLLKYSGVRVL